MLVDQVMGLTPQFITHSQAPINLSKKIKVSIFLTISSLFKERRRMIAED